MTAGRHTTTLPAGPFHGQPCSCAWCAQWLADLQVLARIEAQRERQSDLDFFTAMGQLHSPKNGGGA